jgi:hypothetical protein
MLPDNGELLLEADEMDFIAIRLQPACPAMRVPTLFTGSSVSEADGGSKEILDRNTHAGAYNIKKAPRGTVAGLSSCSVRRVRDGRR